MFYFASFLLVTIGISALPLIEGFYAIAVLTAVVFASGFILSACFHKFYFSRYSYSIALICAAVVGIAALLLSGKFGDWEVVWLIWYLILSFQVVDILAKRNARKWVFSYLLAFIQLALGGIFTERTLFLVLFLLFLVLAIVGFARLLSVSELKEKLVKKSRLNSGGAKWGALTTANVFLFTGLIFFILPRMQSPLLEIK
ncbi:MAG: transglutaminaseTgpA domain-containing protein, partial [Candidatus Omnitrophica bacterium]|nr:transglutaminaseTgpA domain-containing protein [Candidatus Omnitrophota bacterium]